MMFIFPSLAAMAIIPLALAMPADLPAPSKQNENSDSVSELFQVDPDNWLQAVSEEALKQNNKALNVANNTLEARQGNWQFQAHGSYTDRLVNVGDVDIFYMFWQRMYEIAGERGGLSDVSRGALSKFCNLPGASPGVQTRFILDGQWGAVNGLSGWQMRDALIKSMWGLAGAVGKEYGYTVYNNCYGYGTVRSVPYDKNSVCGGRPGSYCPTNKDCPGRLECRYMKWGTWLPSIMRINIYNRNGSLRADALQARISSRNTGGGGCGKAGAIAGWVFDLIPVVGVWFGTGLRVNCLFQD